METGRLLHVKRIVVGAVSAGFFHRSGTDAAGADLDVAYAAVFHRPHFLQVRLENLLGLIMGMADIAARHRFLSANFTYVGHDGYLLID